MTADLSYGNDGASPGNSLKWSAVGLAGKQGVILIFSLVLARILGPAAYGLVAQATVYIALTTLLLDQGVSAALTNVGSLSRRTAGAASTFNFILAVALCAATFVVSPLISSFFRQPELTAILNLLGVGLVFKAFAIVPRMMLARRLDFRSTALSDFSGAAVGGLVGLAIALATGSYWSLVVQTIAMDAVTMVVLVIAARPPLPNPALHLMRAHMGFSMRVFGSNFVGYLATNSANILIGRVLGSTQVGFYNFAFGFLQLPVSITGQIMNRVVFPVVARKAYLQQPVAPLVERALRGVSVLTFPLMAFLAVAAHDLVALVLGTQWLPAVPVMMILALSGARQSLTTLNTPILLGLGKASLQLRFSVAAAALQITAVAVGLLWGIVGVAAGFTIAGFVLTPVISLIQKRQAGVSYSAQWRAIYPALHSSIWLVAGYLLIKWLLPHAEILSALLGALVGLGLFIVSFRLFHPRAWRSVSSDAQSVLSRKKK